MKLADFGLALAALGLAFTLAQPAPDALAGGQVTTCAKRAMVATGSSVIAKKLAEIDAEIAWELKVIKKHGLLWYSWWASKNHSFRCKKNGRRTICVARGTPCRLI